MRYIIDRIENNIAVCETSEKEHVFFETQKLYHGIKEGDIFEIIDNECIFLSEETRLARNKNIALQKSLFEE